MDPIFSVDHNSVICDYTLEKVDVEDAENTPLYTVHFTFNHDSEPVWYEDFHALCRELKLKIDYGSFSNFINSAWHFAHTEVYGAADYSWFLFSEWVKNRRGKDKKAPYRDCATVEQMMSKRRQDNLRKLLSEKRFTPEELGLELE